MSVFKKSKNACPFIIGLTLLLSILLSESTFAVLQEDTSKTSYYNERPTTGTDYTFAIYCSGPDITSLPYY